MLVTMTRFGLMSSFSRPINYLLFINLMSLTPLFCVKAALSTVALDGDEVIRMCPQNHAMVVMDKNPLNYRSGLGFCNICSRKIIDAEWSGAFHCEACRYDVCINCKSKVHLIAASTGAAPGNTALMLAAEAGHLTVVDRLLAAGADASVVAPNGDSALLLACRSGHVAVATRLLGVREDSLSVANKASYVRRGVGHGGFVLHRRKFY